MNPETQAQTSAALESSVSIPLNRSLTEWVWTSDYLVNCHSICSARDRSLTDPAETRLVFHDSVCAARTSMPCSTSPPMLWIVWITLSGTPSWCSWIPTASRVSRTWGPGSVPSPGRAPGSCMSVLSNWERTIITSSPVSRPKHQNNIISLMLLQNCFRLSLVRGTQKFKFKFYLSHTRLYRDCITSSEMWEQKEQFWSMSWTI